MNTIIRLRPHHLLCLQHFIGKGYNETFVKNTREVLKSLQKGCEIHLVPGCDTVCRACPENMNGLCRKQEEIAEIDRKVLETFALKPGQLIDWKTIISRKKGLNIPLLKSICGDCQWISICLKR